MRLRYSFSAEEELELLSLLALRRKRRRKIRMWVSKIFSSTRAQGEYHNLLQEMRLSDQESHERYLRMSRQRFNSLLQMVCWNYIPPPPPTNLTIDGEDGAGNLTPGRWRNDEEPVMGMGSVAHTGSNRYR